MAAFQDNSILKMQTRQMCRSRKDINNSLQRHLWIIKRQASGEGVGVVVVGPMVVVRVVARLQHKSEYQFEHSTGVDLRSCSCKVHHWNMLNSYFNSTLAERITPDCLVSDSIEAHQHAEH